MLKRTAWHLKLKKTPWGGGLSYCASRFVLYAVVIGLCSTSLPFHLMGESIVQRNLQHVCNIGQAKHVWNILQCYVEGI